LRTAKWSRTRAARSSGDDAGHALYEDDERTGGLGVVLVHALVAELDPGLDDEGQHPLPRFVQPAGPEGRLRQLERARRVLGPCHLRSGGVVPLAAGGRDLGADHVDGRRSFLPTGAFRGGGEVGRPAGRGLGVGVATGVVGEAHARVEVDLGGPRPHVPPHQLPGLRHGRVRALAPPGVGAQVVAAEEHAARGEARSLGPTAQPGRELRRGDAGVAALLVYLVRGGLDEDRDPEVPAGLERRVEDVGVRGADRPDPARLAALLGGHGLPEGFRPAQGDASAGRSVSQLSHRSRFSATKASSVRWG
jgi:hypothetical protein